MFLKTPSEAISAGLHPTHRAQHRAQQHGHGPTGSGTASAFLLHLTPSHSTLRDLPGSWPCLTPQETLAELEQPLRDWGGIPASRHGTRQHRDTGKARAGLQRAVPGVMDPIPSQQGTGTGTRSSLPCTPRSHPRVTLHCSPPSCPATSQSNVSCPHPPLFCTLFCARVIPSPGSWFELSPAPR